MRNTVYIFLIISLSIFCNGLIEDKTVTLSKGKQNSCKKFETFGFEKGALIFINSTVTSSRDNLKLYICGYKTCIQANCAKNSYCKPPTDPNNKLFDLSNPYINHTITEQNSYNFFLLYCGQASPELYEIDVTLHYHLINPNDQELPFGSYPLPRATTVLTGLWILLLLIQTLSYLKSSRYCTPLHGFLGLVTLLKLTVISISLCYWRIYSKTGHRNNFLDYLECFLYAVSETAFFCVLFLIAKGWRITRTTLPPSELRTISVLLILLLSTLLFFSFYDDNYYFLSLMFMYFFMLPKIFTSIMRNTRTLDAQMALYIAADQNVDLSTLLVKSRMFRSLRISVILYLIGIILVNSIRIIQLWDIAWFNTVANELIMLGITWEVCYLIRPRANGVFSASTLPLLNDVLDVQSLFENRLGMLLDHNNINFPREVDLGRSIVVEWPSEKSGSKEPGLVPLSFGVEEGEDDFICNKVQN